MGLSAQMGLFRPLAVLALLLLAGCQEPLRCTSASVVARVNVKLDREMSENIRFPASHEPKRSNFTVDGVEQGGASEGALRCIARFRAALSASPAFAKAHGFPAPTETRTLERRVRFTAHTDGWDTFVEIVGLDAPPTAVPTTVQARDAPG